MRREKAIISQKIANRKGNVEDKGMFFLERDGHPLKELIIIVK